MKLKDAMLVAFCWPSTCVSRFGHTRFALRFPVGFLLSCRLSAFHGLCHGFLQLSFEGVRFVLYSLKIFGCWSADAFFEHDSHSGVPPPLHSLAAMVWCGFLLVTGTCCVVLWTWRRVVDTAVEVVQSSVTPHASSSLFSSHFSLRFSLARLL